MVALLTCKKFRTMTVNLVSAWSAAGIGTCVVVEASLSRNSNNYDATATYKKRLRIAFDIGTTPNFMDSVAASFVAITHTHIDHVGAIFNHARSFRLSHGGKHCKYFVPKQSINDIFSAIESMSQLVKEDLIPKENVVGIEAGDEIQLIHGGPPIYLRAFSVSHRDIAALGYQLVTKIVRTNYCGKKKRDLLKEEYRDMSHKQIGEQVRKGVDIRIPKIVLGTEISVDFAYTGDAGSNSFLCNRSLSADFELERRKYERSLIFLRQVFSQASTLVMELTFLTYNCEREKKLAKDRGHIHISEVSAVLRHNGWFCRDEPGNIVFLHISPRHKPVKKALDLIIAGLRQGSTEREFQQIKDYCFVAVEALLPEVVRSDDHFSKKIKDHIKAGCISISFCLQHGLID
mmetsp:Transcript_18570/g.24107  ORF Transcript_18570/g.24107 Transcript_18570/m.24107 type:complete len:403 (+) Transcript_18570:93-1301(+)